MISLKIKNLILVENAEIFFGPALNILTGETGAGKSAILQAVRLISGERADLSCIRQGTLLAVVEAEMRNGLTIRREIHRSGKNRCFINDELVNLSELKELNLIEMIDQNSASTLFEKQKQLLDLFSGTEEKNKNHAHLSALEKKLLFELEELQKIPKERELEWTKKDLEWMEEIGWTPLAEEKLSEEHNLLSHAQELAVKMNALVDLFDNHLPDFKRTLPLLENAARIDCKLQPVLGSVKSAILELNEASGIIQSYLDRLDVDPSRFLSVKKKLSDFEMLKKRFGTDIEAQKKTLQDTLEKLLNLDVEIQEKQQRLQTLQTTTQQLSREILKERTEKAPLFSDQVQKELRGLNMPHADFEIVVGPTLNDVHFYFSANAGVPPSPIENCASGGEISRIFLAIKTVLLDGTSSLVFDEIDSNVGGQTAGMLGEKLKALSKKRQVLCVTHFVQVAKQAQDHFLVAKVQEKKQSHTLVKKLDEKERELEYNRMLGSI